MVSVRTRADKRYRRASRSILSPPVPYRAGAVSQARCRTKPVHGPRSLRVGMGTEPSGAGTRTRCQSCPVSVPRTARSRYPDPRSLVLNVDAPGIASVRVSFPPIVPADSTGRIRLAAILPRRYPELFAPRCATNRAEMVTRPSPEPPASAGRPEVEESSGSVVVDVDRVVRAVVWLCAKPELVGEIANLVP